MTEDTDRGPARGVTAATPVDSFVPLVDTVKSVVVANVVEGTRGAHDQVPAHGDRYGPAAGGVALQLTAAWLVVPVRPTAPWIHD